MSSPVNHSTLLVADLRDDPVPTTSPTYATTAPEACALACSALICAMGPRLPSSSGVKGAPSRLFFSMASACSGMSGRLQASGAGDRSSVLVSPGTLNTVSLMLCGTSGREVNHSASAQLCSTPLACALPLSALALTSWNWSNMSKVFFRPTAATAATASLSSRSISGVKL